MAVRGTPEEAREFVNKHHKLILDMAKIITRGTFISEDDISQDVVLRLLRNNIVGAEDVRSYIARVTRRVVIQHLRSRQRAARREHDKVEMDDRDSEAPIKSIDHREETEKLVRALLRLSPLLQETLRLRYIEGLKAGAIARRLGVPVETIRTRLKRGGAELGRILQPPLPKRPRRVRRL